MPLKALLACCVLLLAAAVHASDGEPATPASGTAEYQAAGKAFLARVAEAEATQKPEMLGDDDTSRLIAVLSDEKRFLKPGPYAAADLVELEDICKVGTRNEAAIMAFGAKSAAAAAGDKNDLQGKLLKIMTRRNDNMRQFGGILARLEPFRYRCLARLKQPLTETLSAPGYEMTKERKSALRDMQAMSFLAILDGTIFLDVSKSDADRIAIAKAIAENIGDMVQPLPLTRRLVIADTSDAPSRSAPDNLKPYWAKIFAALNDTTCNIACQQR